MMNQDVGPLRSHLLTVIVVGFQCLQMLTVHLPSLLETRAQVHQIKLCFDFKYVNVGCSISTSPVLDSIQLIGRVDSSRYRRTQSSLGTLEETFPFSIFGPLFVRTFFSLVAPLVLQLF